MNLSIENSIATCHAEKCDFDKHCIDSKVHKFCKVVDNVNGKIIFVEHLGRNCNYKFKFGYETICSCPVRNKIHRLYNI